jgi:hypothetical protein
MATAFPDSEALTRLLTHIGDNNETRSNGCRCAPDANPFPSPESGDTNSKKSLSPALSP